MTPAFATGIREEHKARRGLSGRAGSAHLAAGWFAKAKLAGAVLEPFCKTYGASVWKVNLTRAQQLDLQITPGGESPLSIDSMEAAQIIYLFP
jgi:hypothetical protein